MERASFGWAAYSPVTAPAPQEEAAFEIADLSRYGRHLMRRFVHQARAADRPTLRSIIEAHLGGAAAHLPIVEERWPAYEHVNVQAALDAGLAERPHELVGITNYRHRGPFQLSDLLGGDPMQELHGPRPGNVTRVSLPCGPGGATRECLRPTVILTEVDEEPIALLLQTPDADNDTHEVALELVCHALDKAQQLAAELRERRSGSTSIAARWSPSGTACSASAPRCCASTSGR
ncbi:MAG: hypothetical protein QM638_19575 [Nocardioides sp.]|uniref:hypothetical protein n=1 Tax=Nocardioides sp. TaxID=35761 RepID=UPI0039E63B41